MNIISIIFIILGLCLFEITQSIDNVVVNAQILANMSERAKRWFLLWGVLVSVILIRGILPWLILYISEPGLGFFGALVAGFSSQPETEKIIVQGSPRLFLSGGVFLILLFSHWLFLEKKNIAFTIERFFMQHSKWFYAFSVLFLLFILMIIIPTNFVLAIAAIIGEATYLIVHGIRQYAGNIESRLGSQTKLSDWSKILYLMVIDATFSFDSVLGAFAFTISIPLILIGSGIGAVVVNRLTVRSIGQIRKYIYLENGAMYAIGCLGIVMLIEGFGYSLPEWVSPLVTVLIITIFFFKSRHSTL